MSGWVAFRQKWVKPEVYPLIGSMVVAVGAATYALVGKAVKDDAYTTWSKSKRSGQVDLLEAVDEVVPLMASSKHGSIRIFGKENDIRTNKLNFNNSEPLSFTVRIGEEEEEEMEEAEAASEDQSLDSPDVQAAAAVVDAVVADAASAAEGTVDEAEETINAAIDAALDAAAPETSAPAPAPASVVEPASATELPKPESS